MENRKVLEVIIPGEPKALERARRGHYGQFYDPNKSIKRMVGSYMLKERLEQRIKPLMDDFEMVVYFYGARKNADLDNLLKLVLDAGNGVLWEDDRQLKKVIAQKKCDNVNPRTELFVFV